MAAQQLFLRVRDLLCARHKQPVNKLFSTRHGPLGRDLHRCATCGML
jgi:hypothetical protein